jgi:hypothetical protein
MVSEKKHYYWEKFDPLLIIKGLYNEIKAPLVLKELSNLKGLFIIVFYFENKDRKFLTITLFTKNKLQKKNGQKSLQKNML